MAQVCDPKMCLAGAHSAGHKWLKWAPPPHPPPPPPPTADVLTWCPLCRPLKAQVYNCQLLIDLAGRNALWGAAAHLFEAFKPLGAPQTPPAAAPASSTVQTPSLPRAPSGLQRGGSSRSLMGPRKGAFGGASSAAAAKLPRQDSLAQGKEIAMAHAAFDDAHVQSKT